MTKITPQEVRDTFGMSTPAEAAARYGVSETTAQGILDEVAADVAAILSADLNDETFFDPND